MELLTTVGEQLGCLLMLSRLEEAKGANGSADLVLSSSSEHLSGR
jgi:hypothetical protein